MHRGQTDESWTMKQLFFMRALDSRGNPYRSCYLLSVLGRVEVFSNSTVSFLVLLLFFFWNTPLGLLVAISFGYFLWSNAAATDEKKNC